MALPRIFVAIASYRDTECQHTLHDLFTRAEHPERVFAGVCWQFDPERDAGCFAVPPPYPKQVRQSRHHIRDSKGCCWARSQALKLWDGEDYILQIDSHMRFEPGWDSKMIATLARCPGKALLSTAPADYEPPDQRMDCTGQVPVTRVSMLGGPGDLQPVYLTGFLRRTEELGGRPLLGAFIVGNFIFAPAAMFHQVPFDPHIYFRGQEPVYSARLWTHGWDIYQPDVMLLYHYWKYVGPEGRKAVYKTPTPEARLARQRVMHVLGIVPAADPAALVDIEKYGMGKVRPLEDFWRFADIDLRRRIIGEKASTVAWTPYISPPLPPGE